LKAIILNFETKQALAQRFEQTRALTESLLAHLSEEDQCVQSMPDASPAKWHLGHTTWFFETVVLSEHCPNYKYSIRNLPIYSILIMRVWGRVNHARNADC
jgi:hypothetical protein